MTSTSTAYIALGSNLGRRRAAIESAIAALRETPGIRVGSVAELIETAPMGPPDQGRFLNSVVGIETDLQPRALLALCQDIERRAGRDRGQERRWGPRALDLDILLYGDAVIDEPDLKIPHPGLPERLFVLEPLASIAPSQQHPTLGMTVETLLQRARAAAALAGGPAGPEP